LNPSVASAQQQPVKAPEPVAAFTPQLSLDSTPKPAAAEAPKAADPSVQAEALPAVPNDVTDNTSPEAKEQIDEALRLRDAGKTIAARELLENTLSMQLSPTLRSGVKLQLAKLAETWLWGPKVLDSDKLTESYTVQRGDLLQNIAQKYKVPYEILMQINGISRPELLRAGQTIKVINGPFNAVVYKDSFVMDLYLQNKYVKTYRVGLGRQEYETPNGRWRVDAGGKLIKPTWTDPDTGKTYVGDDPDYPLGSRWIALEGLEGEAKGRTGFAIHGTKDPETIGTRSSRGCIRLFNGDAVEVYNLLYAGISEVLIKD
jgi:LysM repeat protein